MKLHNRVIRPGFWTDTELIEHLSVSGRLYYMGLVQLADDSGCLFDDALAHKIHLFPGDDDVTRQDIAAWRDTLVRLGKAIAYTANGRACLYLKNFHRHQKLRSPAPPEVPLPPWVQWEPSDEPRRTGRYIISAPYGQHTVTVPSPYGDQPEPEPEPEEREEEACAQETKPDETAADETKEAKTAALDLAKRAFPNWFMGGADSGAVCQIWVYADQLGWPAMLVLMRHLDRVSRTRSPNHALTIAESWVLAGVNCAEAAENMIKAHSYSARASPGSSRRVVEFDDSPVYDADGNVIDYGKLENGL